MESKDRLGEILLHLQISANKLSKEIGHDNNVKIHYIKTGRNDISEDVARDIEKRYPEFSYEWILYGRGVMIKDQNRSHDSKFESMQIEDKLKLIYEQNSKILKEYLEIREIISNQTNENRDHKNIIIDYIDLALQPINDFVGATKRERKNN